MNWLVFVSNVFAFFFFLKKCRHSKGRTEQNSTYVVWPHACGHWSFTVHPLQLELGLWRPSFMWPPALGISLRKGADNCIVLKNTHSLTHLNVAPKGTSTPVRPLFSQHPIIYTVNTCPAPYGGWNYSNRVTYEPCSWQIYERQDGLNVLVKQETRSEKEEDWGGADIFFFFFAFVWESIYWVAFGVMPDSLLHRWAQSKLD